MRLVSVRNCRPGQKLAKSIYNEYGVTLLSANIELTSILLKRLETLGISHIYIQDARTDDIIIKDPITDETRMLAISKIRTSFRKLMDENLTGRKPAPHHFIGQDFREIVEIILDDLEQNQQAMMMLSTINVTDLYLYQHSLNVCIYTTMLGMANGYTRDELTTLGMGAMLHDIGKTKIPLEILRKPHRLSDEEYAIMKNHTTLGFNILKDEPNIPLIVAHCAFQHHERYNGSGYPRQIAGDEIHEYAAWIGMVDSYDAMTSNRVYREAMLPHQAMERLYTESGILFEKEKIEIFRNSFALYPLGVTVELNTGEVGVVVDINSSLPQRPVVRIIQDVDKQELKQPYEIDMSKRLNVVIVGVNDVKIVD